MTDPAAVEALAAGFAKGLGVALRLEHPDLAWQIDVGPVDRAKLARLKARDEGVELTGQRKMGRELMARRQSEEGTG